MIILPHRIGEKVPAGIPQNLERYALASWCLLATWKPVEKHTMDGGWEAFNAMTRVDFQTREVECSPQQQHVCPLKVNYMLQLFGGVLVQFVPEDKLQRQSAMAMLRVLVVA
jgi:hypothetical protein